MVDSGVLAGKRKGRSVRVNASSFYDWMGESVPLILEWGMDYEVFPDDQAKKVKKLQKARRKVQATFR